MLSEDNNNNSGSIAEVVVVVVVLSFDVLSLCSIVSRCCRYQKPKRQIDDLAINRGCHKMGGMVDTSRLLLLY